MIVYHASKKNLLMMSSMARLQMILTMHFLFI